MSVLALPMTALRSGRKVAGHLKLPALVGAAALVYRKARRSAPEPIARVMPEGPPLSAPTPPTVAPRAGHETVVDPVPLAEAAFDPDVEVMLASELPIRSYDALSAKDVVPAIRELTDAEEVRTVLAFEEENAKRSTVLTAARAHLAGLATNG